MPESSRPLKIKNFGKDRSFSSIPELKEVLSSEYRNEHISIIYPTKPNGLNAVIYVSVDEFGIVRETYGKKAEIDFSQIGASLMQ